MEQNNELLQGIEDILKNFLQYEIKLVFNNRVIKQGKLVLFKLFDFNMLLYIKNQKKDRIEKISLPIPFLIKDLTNPEKGVYFSYKNEDLFENSLKELINDLLDDKLVIKSKYYNNSVKIVL